MKIMIELEERTDIKPITIMTVISRKGKNIRNVCMEVEGIIIDKNGKLNNEIMNMIGDMVEIIETHHKKEK